MFLIINFVRSGKWALYIVHVYSLESLPTAGYCCNYETTEEMHKPGTADIILTTIAHVSSVRISC